MIIPGISGQHSPGPDTRVVVSPSTRSCAPQIEKESRQVEYRLVHEITCKASRKGENVREPIKDTRLSDARVKTTSLVLVLRPRGENMEQIRLVILGSRDREGVDVDVGVRGRPMIFKAFGS